MHTKNTSNISMGRHPFAQSGLDDSHMLDSVVYQVHRNNKNKLW